MGLKLTIITILLILSLFLYVGSQINNNLDDKLSISNKSINETKKVFSESLSIPQNIVKNVTLITNITNYIKNITYVNETKQVIINFFYPREFNECPNNVLTGFIKQGQSMNPFLYDGDKFNYYKTNIVNIKLGDVINFENNQGGNTLHAVVGKYIDDKGKTYLITQGYSEPRKDSMRVYQENLIGKYCVEVSK